MDEIARWPDAKRADLFREAAARRAMVPAVIEKDFWVCWVLARLFAANPLRDKILFKGGTSLSKVFGLIDRFSEDIDLVLNWTLIADEDPALPRSRSKQDQFNKQTLLAARAYLKDVFLPLARSLLAPDCMAAIDETTPDVINVRYPAAFQEGYLRPEVRLEIGPLAAWLPNAEFDISPYAAEPFPALFGRPAARVRAVAAERSFWEKATILHQEAHRRDEVPFPLRHSRHYYDLMRIGRSSIKQLAFRSLALLREVVAFKQKFYPQAWARYDLARPGTFRLVPSASRLAALRKDYQEMRIMIFGQPPGFDEILAAIQTLEQEINSLEV